MRWSVKQLLKYLIKGKKVLHHTGFLYLGLHWNLSKAVTIGPNISYRVVRFRQTFCIIDSIYTLGYINLF